eukprot:221875-Chlamydomonas_euryale.AAC.1
MNIDFHPDLTLLTRAKTIWLRQRMMSSRISTAWLWRITTTNGRRNSFCGQWAAGGGRARAGIEGRRHGSGERQERGKRGEGGKGVRGGGGRPAWRLGSGGCAGMTWHGAQAGVHWGGRECLHRRGRRERLHRRNVGERFNKPLLRSLCLKCKTGSRALRPQCTQAVGLR